MDARTNPAETLTSKELLAAARYDARRNRYPGNCDECGNGLAAERGRLVRPAGAKIRGQWVLLCRNARCTAGHLRAMRVSGGESGGNPIDNA